MPSKRRLSKAEHSNARSLAWQAEHHVAVGRRNSAATTFGTFLRPVKRVRPFRVHDECSDCGGKALNVKDELLLQWPSSVPHS
jgi:hypothetical protein